MIRADFFYKQNKLDKLNDLGGFEKNSYRAMMKEGHSVAISRTAYGPLKKVLGL